MKYKEIVVIGLSGGVDSSVAAALLVEAGYEVIGVMLRLWNPPGCDEFNRCCTPEAMALARQVATQLDIPFYALDARQPFHKAVVKYFLDSYMQGITPNPCLACNQHVRWGFLLQQALAMGAHYLATGHYARLEHIPEDGVRLLRGLDQHKDQSYVLSLLNQDQLSHSLFPLGGYVKTEIRQKAASLGLPVADRPDSQDLCFIGEQDYRQFLVDNIPQVVQPGTILDRDGQKLGEHQGLAFYTIGQRKGIRIAAEKPYYVLAKDFTRNALIIGPRTELGRDELTVRPVNWIAGQPPAEPCRVQVKIRYKADDAWGVITPQDGDKARVKFDNPLRDITPGQAAVFYNDDVCLGGGIIVEE